MPDIAQTIPPVPVGDTSIISKELGLYTERIANDLRRDLHVLKNEDSTFLGAMEIDGSVDVSGSFSVGGDLTVNGTVIWNGDLSAGGDAWFDGSVDISGAVDCSVLSVDTSANISGELACASDLAVVGDFSVDGTAVFGAKAIFESDVSGVGYVDRGDPAAVDYDGTGAGSFSTFGTWTELDLPTDVGVPTAAKAVNIYVILINNAAGVNFSFRDSGDSNTASRINVRSQVGGVQTSSPMIVSSANGKIDYRVDDVGVWAQLEMVVLGWWL